VWKNRFSFRFGPTAIFKDLIKAVSLVLVGARPPPRKFFFCFISSKQQKSSRFFLIFFSVKNAFPEIQSIPTKNKKTFQSMSGKQVLSTENKKRKFAASPSGSVPHSKFATRVFPADRVCVERARGKTQISSTNSTLLQLSLTGGGGCLMDALDQCVFGILTAKDLDGQIQVVHAKYPHLQLHECGVPGENWSMKCVSLALEKKERDNPKFSYTLNKLHGDDFKKALTTPNGGRYLVIGELNQLLYAYDAMDDEDWTHRGRPAANPTCCQKLLISAIKLLISASNLLPG
jgi:hypothetical protein